MNPGRWIFTVIFSIMLFLFFLWCILAIYFSGLPGENTPMILSALFGISVSMAFIFLPNRKRTAIISLLVFLGVLVAWNRIQPSHDRIWEPSVGKLPFATQDGNLVTVHNVRDFDYRSEDDFTVRYYNKTYDLDKLDSVDYVLSYWDGNQAIAHTILSFDFSDGNHLAVSVETRLEKDEPQNTLDSFFKQFELIYILADEADLLRLRTNFRKEEVFLYPTTIKKENVRKMFDIVVKRVNSIAKEPEFYNALTENCFTSLARDFSRISAPKNLLDYRRLANGYSDQMLYENGKIDSTLDFEQTRNRHHINQYVEGNMKVEEYSKLIRP